MALRLKEEFKERKPEREYDAIVKGRVDSERGTFRSFLATDEDLNQYSTGDGSGKLAITHYEVADRFPDATHVRVTLETGRRNQIRVHFAEAGHPVLGDPRYAPQHARHRDWPHQRLALHAARLGFYHPTLRKVLRFSAELPPEMSAFLRRETAA
jgi:23S rRNA pseudouridine1911/1915/1917 synthase